MAALSYHKRSCAPSKKRLHSVLSAARELFEQRKRARIAIRTLGAQADAPKGVETGEPSNHAIVNQSDIAYSPLLEGVGAGGANSGISGIGPDHEPSSRNDNDQLEDHFPLAQRRQRRMNRQPPKRYRDLVPLPPPLLANRSPSPSSELAVPSTENPRPTDPRLPPQPDAPSTQVPRLFRHFSTPTNIFGIFRRFYGLEPPSTDPEETMAFQDLVEPAEGCADPLPLSSMKDPSTAFFPYPNQSSFALGEWYWNHGAQKAHADFQNLLDIVGHPDFDPRDIKETKWSEVNAKLACGERSDGPEWQDENGDWKRTAVAISVPFHRRMKERLSSESQFLVGDFYHRSIVSVIKERVAQNHEPFFYEPCELLWKPLGRQKETRVYGELYTSEAFLVSHRDLMESLPEPGCDAPRAIVALMFWSDATHLTSFGQAKLWPAYMYFGNNSKYQRCRPSRNLANHVAYFQRLLDAFKDFFTEHSGGKKISKELMKHCHREAFHAQWEVLLDDEFVTAWKHGILIHCGDGVMRRLYPRIFTYSANYPEKALIAGIRNKGICPCPRCLLPASLIPNMGTKSDMDIRGSTVRIDDQPTKDLLQEARSCVYDGEYAVSNKEVEKLLKPRSLLPAKNAFSMRLSHLKFNFYDMLVVDLLHEFELGVWRALFIQLIRILNAINVTLINEVDRRYRQIPRFGRGVIRKFSANVSELKKMAARDYEDLLQCAPPVFDGLFPPPHNEIIQDLLFLCAHWHALAKLRMHTDVTLRILEHVTTSLGDAFRRFESTTCSAYTTYELPKEFEARQRREAKRRAGNHLPNEGEPGAATAPAKRGRKKRAFNMATYKFHSLADYPGMIRAFGTSDSYSTELGELEHRTPKARYRRTNKKDYIRQMAQIERRQAHLRRIRTRNFPGSLDDEESTTVRDSELHHKIGRSENAPQHIGLFIERNEGDPAIKGFIPKLKKHLLPRIMALLEFEGGAERTEENWEKLTFHRDRIYSHATLRINFTRYDVCREEDMVHTGGTQQSNIMALNPNFDPDLQSEGNLDTGHLFLYARVLGIFHTNVVYIGGRNRDYRPRRMEFLWVRWFDIRSAGSWKARRLDQLQFPTVFDDDSFGFLDPNDVLRGCHLIPSFVLGRVYSAQDCGISRCAGDRNDYKSYFVNRFVDRDVLIRFHWGAGVGHTYTGSKDQHPPSNEEGDQDEETTLSDIFGIELQNSMGSSEDAPAGVAAPTQLRCDESLSNPESGDDEDEEEDNDDGDDDRKSEHSLYGHGDDSGWEDEIDEDSGVEDECDW